MNKIFITPPKSDWQKMLQRPAIDYKQLETQVASVLEDVRLNGDSAVKKFTQLFDGVSLDDLKVSRMEIAEAVADIDADLKTAIEMARSNITKFHQAQKEPVVKTETVNGVLCWRRSVAIEKVGLYIPGGSAPLFSTLLMLGIPALLAGCTEIIVCTPPGKAGKIDPAILYVAQLIGIKNIYKAGGIQAVAAMAYGTQTVSKVNKIFGPGNQYVTCAKQLVNASGIAIDMPAGPSELAVYADETCNAAFVASDLLSQAEHGADSQVVLVASSLSIVEAVQLAIEKQLADLPRNDIAEMALQNSFAVVMPNTADAFELLNEYAPEHLIIASDNAEALAENIINAGSVFLGHYAPGSAGDYASGTNHTLPTNGFAKAYSGVSLDSFVKKITFQQINKTGIKNIGKAIEIMAAAEGLEAHKNAVTVRLTSLKN
ncbi:MAG: histidinol dehydrogenase [Chitinophagaceae bacterium]|nr:histidinol dehydrogenase [Chitinophagaceae bacterium]MBK9532483.1 histidinol dehydrogenase [Chitinophagaceae bacterium]